uniref:Alpha-carbonic anhydrase domain-containing protein n=1 Tax=Cynoglossus semilaevis TaxID=244447 RepID=A0A3P8WSV9_CYNSE
FCLSVCLSTDKNGCKLSPKYCNGSRQSPINIKTSAAKADSTLTEFTFTKYNDKSLLKEIVNTGKTSMYLLHYFFVFDCVVFVAEPMRDFDLN